MSNHISAPGWKQALGGMKGGQQSVLKTKSVYSPIDRKRDGLRILATRYPGRGLRKSRYDVWMASLGPSERLLADARKGDMSWDEFKKRYEAELLMAGPLDGRNKKVKNRGQKFTLRLIRKLARSGNVTLMCQCREHKTECHRHVLKDLILSKRI